MGIWIYGYRDMDMDIYIYPLVTGTALPSRRFWTRFALGPSGLWLHPTGALENDGCHARPTLLLQGEPLGYDQPKWDNHWDTESDTDDNDE